MSLGISFLIDEPWEINGIRGCGDLPPLAGKFSGPLVVLGSARGLWDDLAQVKGNPDYMAINLAGLHVQKKLAHWATWHSECIPHYMGLYWEGWPVQNHEVHTHAPILYPYELLPAENNWNFDMAPEIKLDCGSSSLFAVCVALALGYYPVLLAGIPLEPCGCFYDPPWMRSFDYQRYQKAWEQANKVFQGRVKSYSGYTRELLGAPD
jgi:hypothetical protein